MRMKKLVVLAFTIFIALSLAVSGCVTSAPTQITPSPSQAPTVETSPASPSSPTTPPPAPSNTSGTISTSPKPCCPCGTPPAQLIQYTGATLPVWDRIPTILISSKPEDLRIKLTEEAINFWNKQFADLGTPFRLGAVNLTTDLIPDDYLQKLSKAQIEKTNKPTPPPLITNFSENLIISLSDGEFLPFASPMGYGKCLIGIRNCSISPFNLTNAPRNFIAHELGHVVGLGHNNDPTKLMCGIPAICGRAIDFRCDIEQFFPLTEEDKLNILRLYPKNWAPKY
jgi:hypothetical protein